MRAISLSRRFTPRRSCRVHLRRLDFAVPAGCGGFNVTITVTGPNAVVDLGCTGPDGWRGWSGAARRAFSISDDSATPGFLPGVIAGSWQLVIGLHRVPQEGVDLQADVRFVPSLGSQAPTPPPSPARPPRRDLPATDGMTWLAGDLHCHTVHSDGADSIDTVAALAVSAGLDFLAVTDHNTTSHHRFLPPAGSRYGITLVPGQEVTSWRGHANVFGAIGFVDFRAPADDWFRVAQERGGLASVNHPVSGECAGVSIPAAAAPGDLALQLAQPCRRRGSCLPSGILATIGADRRLRLPPVREHPHAGTPHNLGAGRGRRRARRAGRGPDRDQCRTGSSLAPETRRGVSRRGCGGPPAGHP